MCSCLNRSHGCKGTFERDSLQDVIMLICRVPLMQQSTVLLWHMKKYEKRCWTHVWTNGATYRCERKPRSEICSGLYQQVDENRLFRMTYLQGRLRFLLTTHPDKPYTARCPIEISVPQRLHANSLTGDGFVLTDAITWTILPGAKLIKTFLREI